MGFSSYVNEDTTFDLNGPGTLGTSPQRSDPSNDIANILNIPFSDGNDYTDLTGNHTLAVGNSVLTPGYGPNGEQQLYTNQGGGGAVRTNSSEPAHAIGGTDPVTFGFFFRTNFWNTTSQFMTSASIGGSASANYGLIRFVNGDWGFRGAIGGGSGQAWKVMTNRSPEDTATPRWYHVAFRCEDGEQEGTFFWNGRPIWSGPYGTNGRHIATASDILSLNEANPASDNPGFRGYWGNTFIADRALSDSEIHTLAGEAFGHSPPNTGY